MREAHCGAAIAQRSARNQHAQAKAEQHEVPTFASAECQRAVEQVPAAQEAEANDQPQGVAEPSCKQESAKADPQGPDPVLRELMPTRVMVAPTNVIQKIMSVLGAGSLATRGVEWWWSQQCHRANGEAADVRGRQLQCTLLY